MKHSQLNKLVSELKHNPESSDSLTQKQDSVNEDYYTITAPESIELKIKSSRFIAEAYPSSDKIQAMNILKSVKEKFYDATHHCYAYKFGSSGLEFKTYDDGEPSGSAGKPILFAINKFGYSDITVIITRYFGGTKLGIGGLARAYSQAANEVLSNCEKKLVLKTTSIKIFCTYEDYSLIKNILDEYSVKQNADFTDAVHISADVPIALLTNFSDMITTTTKGRAGILFNEE